MFNNHGCIYEYYFNSLALRHSNIQRSDVERIFLSNKKTCINRQLLDNYVVMTREIKYYLSEVMRITGKHISFAPKAIILHIRLP